MNTRNLDERLFTWRYLIVTLIHFVVNSSFYLVTPILTAYVVNLGATLMLAGLVSGVFSITSLVTRPVSGLVANRFSKKKVQGIAMLIMGASCLCYALVKIPGMMVLFRILQGIGFALYGTSAVATVSFIIPESRIQEGVAYFGLSQVLASAVGPTIGSWVASGVGYSESFLLAAVIMFVAAVVLMMVPIKKEAIAESPKAGVRFSELLDTKLLKIAVFAGLFSLSNGINSTFILMLGGERGIENISMYFAVNAACVIAIRVCLSRFLKGKTVRQILLSMLVAGGLSLVMIGRAYSLPIVLVAAALQAAGQGVVQPFIQAECIRRSRPERRGTASSTFLMCSDIAQGLGALVGGWAVSLFGYSALYVALGLVFWLCIPVVFFFLERPDRAARSA